jgi:hypothetical protein
VCGGGGPDVFLRIAVPLRADLQVEAQGVGFTPRVSLAPPGCQKAPMLVCDGSGVAALEDLSEGTVVTLAIGMDPALFVSLSGVAALEGEPDPLAFTVDVGLRRVLAAGEACLPTVRGRCGGRHDVPAGDQRDRHGRGHRGGHGHGRGRLAVDLHAPAGAGRARGAGAGAAARSVYQRIRHRRPPRQGLRQGQRRRPRRHHRHQDKRARVACETLVKTGYVIVAGEITTSAWSTSHALVRKTIRDIGYTQLGDGLRRRQCGVLVRDRAAVARHRQGVDDDKGRAQGAGRRRPGHDVRLRLHETDELMPLPITLSHRLGRALAEVRKKTSLSFLRPTARARSPSSTIERQAGRVDAVVLSTQHSDDIEAQGPCAST